MNFQPPEEDDPRDDDQRQQEADALSMDGAATVGAFLKACMEKMAADDTTETEITVTVNGHDMEEFNGSPGRTLAAKYSFPLYGHAPVQPVPASEPAKCGIHYIGGLHSTWGCDVCGHRDAHDSHPGCCRPTAPASAPATQDKGEAHER